MNAISLKKRIDLLLYFFIFGLAISGLTAIPLQWELGILNRFLGEGSWMQSLWPDMADWITFVWQGLNDAYSNYPFLQYGTDWLAFAHIMLAIAFIGVLNDPIRNIWLIEFGMIACVLVIPTALIFGTLRGIPLFWQIIDCSFGVIGILPLWLCRKYIRSLQIAGQPAAAAKAA
ncbi:MAG: hypothetical protein WEC37_03625 [Anaerolineales bacterium]